MTVALGYTAREMMIYHASKAVKDKDIVLVGVGLPLIAAALAKNTHAPNLVMLFEAGVVDGNLQRIPNAVGDPSVVTGSIALHGAYNFFGYYLGAGLVDVGFIGAAQIDRFGNINTTVIGNYQNPKVRLPGSGGACDIASLAKRLVIIMPHNPRNFAEKVDFITSVGYLQGQKTRGEAGLRKGGPQVLITDKAVFGFDQETGEMTLLSYHPGQDVAEIKKTIPWELKVADGLKESEIPPVEVLKVLREKIEPAVRVAR